MDPLESIRPTEDDLRTIELFSDGDNRTVLRISGSVFVLNDAETNYLIELVERYKELSNDS